MYWRLFTNNQPLIDPETGEQAVRSFYAKGVHVADAAQNQFGMSLRYEPIKPMFIKLKAIYFGKNYAEFDPISLDLARAGKESWKLPDYQIFNLHAGYKFRMFKASQLYLNFGVLNLFDQMYISDAQNNDNYSGKYQDENGQLNAVYQDFDAKSSGVFFGYGRRYNLSLTYKF